MSVTASYGGASTARMNVANGASSPDGKSAEKEEPNTAPSLPSSVVRSHVRSAASHMRSPNTRVHSCTHSCSIDSLLS